MAAVDDSHLNTAQKRYQSMKEDLKNHDLDHLQSFIDGVCDPEPPDYKKVNGKIIPPLRQVTLKDNAHAYHVGNVIFTSDDNEIQDVTLMVENGETDLYSKDPLPKGPGNPMSSPITDFIMMELVPLWQEKFKAIKLRMHKINEVRAFAHNAPNSPEPRISFGTSITKMMDAKQNGDTANNSPSRKGASGDAVQKHPANKRKRIGLASIPDSVKSQVFERLPDRLKTELFNSVALVAFPNFENMTVAAWNVVSVYEHVGTDSGELHHSVTELKSILLEFDQTYSKERGMERAKRQKMEVKEERPQGSIADDGSGNQVVNREGREEQIADRQQAQIQRPSSRDDRNGSNSNSKRSSPVEPRPAQNGVSTANGNGIPSPRMTQNMLSPNSLGRELLRRDVGEHERRKRPQGTQTMTMQEVKQDALRVAEPEEYMMARAKKSGQPDQSIARSGPSQLVRNGARPNKPSPEQQHNAGLSHPFNSKQNGRNGRPGDSSRGDANQGGPFYQDIPDNSRNNSNTARNGRPAERNRGEGNGASGSSPTFSDGIPPFFENNVRPNNGRPYNNAPPNLGNSKLGRPKPFGNAPEAPMMHASQLSKQDIGSRQA